MSNFASTRKLSLSPTKLKQQPTPSPVLEDEHYLDKFQDETALRGVVIEMVHPILKIAKESNEEVKSHVEKIKELTAKIQEIERNQFAIKRNEDAVNKLQTFMVEVDQNTRGEVRRLKLQVELAVDKIKAQQERLQEVQVNFDRVEHNFSLRDVRIEKNNEIISNYKDLMSEEFNKFFLKVENTIEGYQKSLSSIEHKLKAADIQYTSAKQIIDDFNVRMACYDYQLEQKQKQFDEFREEEFTKVNSLVQQLEDQIRTDSINVNDIIQQLRVTENRVEPAFKRLKSVETFLQHSLAFIIHMQISDALQEFLSIPDRLKLLQFDNKKIKEIINYQKDTGEDLPTRKKSQNVAQDLNQQKPVFDSEKQLIMFQRRVQVLLDFMASCGKGCFRFEYGRDWRKHMNEEMVEYLDLGYTLKLDNNFAVLQRLQKQMQLENKLRQEEEAQKPQTNAEMQQQLKRDESQNFGISGNQKEIKIYKQIILVKSQSRQQSRPRRGGLLKQMFNFGFRNNNGIQKNIIDQSDSLDDDEEVESVDEESASSLSQFNLHKTLKSGEDKLGSSSHQNSQRSYSQSSVKLNHQRSTNKLKSSQEKSIHEKGQSSLRKELNQNLQNMFNVCISKIEEIKKKFNHSAAEHKVITDNMQQLTDSLNKAIAQFKSSKSSFSDQVDFIDQQFKNLMKTQNEQISKQNLEIYEFKDYISKEYIDFFKHKKKITQDMLLLKEELNQKCDEIKGELQITSDNVNLVNKMMPMVIEAIQVQVHAFRKDWEDREILHQSLKLSYVPNDGYLLLDNSNPFRQQQLQTQQTQRSTNMLNVNNNCGAQNDKSMQNLKKLYSASDQSLVDNFQGSLNLKQMNYRNKVLTIDSINQLLDNLFLKLEHLIETSPFFFGQNFTTKRFFDDYFVEKISSPIVRASTAQTMKSNLSNLNMTQMSNQKTQKQDTRQSMINVPGLLLKDNFGLPNYKSRNYQLETAKSEGKPNLQKTLTQITKSQNFERIDLKTQDIIYHSKRREEQIKNMLNKTNSSDFNNSIQPMQSLIPQQNINNKTMMSSQDLNRGRAMNVTTEEGQDYSPLNKTTLESRWKPIQFKQQSLQAKRFNKVKRISSISHFKKKQLMLSGDPQLGISIQRQDENYNMQQPFTMGKLSINPTTAQNNL